jgi:hypothetical protein
VLQRQLTTEQLLASVPWLRARNARHGHIYARPSATRHMLVDDLDPDSLSLLMACHRLAAIVETSPWCYQAWLTVAAEPVAPSLAAAVARGLAARFDGDPGATSAVQLGRLPGFTNRKARHERRDGSYSYVLLRQANVCLDPAGPKLLAACVTDSVPPAATMPDSPTPADIRVLHSTASALLIRTPEVEYLEGLRRVLASLPTGVALDRSRADFAVARRLLARGASPSHVRAVLREGARARELPARLAASYVERTVVAATRARAAEVPLAC